MVSLAYRKNMNTNQVYYTLNAFNGIEFKSRTLEKKDGILKLFSKNKDSIVDNESGTKIEIRIKKSIAPQFEDHFITISDPKNAIEIETRIAVERQCTLMVLDNGSQRLNASTSGIYIDSEECKVLYKHKPFNLRNATCVYQPCFYYEQPGLSSFITLIGNGVTKLGSRVSLFLSCTTQSKEKPLENMDSLNSYNVEGQVYNVGDVHFDLSALFNGEKPSKIPIYSMYATSALVFEFESKKETFLDLSGNYLGKVIGTIDLFNGNISEITHMDAYLEIKGDINIWNNQKNLLKSQSYNEILLK